MKTGAPSLESMKKAAIEAALAAGTVLRKNFGTKLKIDEKKNAGLVTNADRAAEEISIKILKKKFPDFGFLAEESDPVKSRGGGRWVIDPLDGTTNFVHGFPMFCVSIAAEWQGKVQVGVIYHPILKEMYLGVRGKGATLNGKKIRVSKTSELRNSLLTTGFTYGKDEMLNREMAAFGNLSQIARAVRRPGSAALDLAYTARGVFDGFWERRLSPWDVAAGYLIVEEAGGMVTDFSGRAFDIENKEILATNSHLHSDLLATLNRDTRNS